MKLLHGKSLVERAVDTALDSAVIDSVYLSSDSPAILKVCERYNSDVIPVQRSDSSSGDSASINDAILELLETFQEAGMPLPDAMMILQPTSPFRKAATIKKAVQLFSEAGGHESVVSVSHAKPHPLWAKKLSPEGVLINYMDDFDETQQSQSLPEAFVLNGLVYLFPVRHFLRNHSIYTDNTQGLVVESAIEAIDIDTPEDWVIAEALSSADVREK